MSEYSLDDILNDTPSPEIQEDIQENTANTHVASLQSNISNPFPNSASPSTSNSPNPTTKDVFAIAESREDFGTPLPVPQPQDKDEYVRKMSKLYGFSRAKIIRDCIGRCMELDKLT